MNCVIRLDSASQDGMLRMTKDYMFISSDNKEMIMKIESPETSIIHAGSKIVYMDNRTGISIETSIADNLPVERSEEEHSLRFEFAPQGLCVYTQAKPDECFIILE